MAILLHRTGFSIASVAVLLVPSVSIFKASVALSLQVENLFQLKTKVFYFQFKSNKRSEDSYIGVADFFCFFQDKVLKVSNKYRCALISINAFMNALFEFN